MGKCFHYVIFLQKNIIQQKQVYGMLNFSKNLISIMKIFFCCVFRLQNENQF